MRKKRIVGRGPCMSNDPLRRVIGLRAASPREAC